MGRAEDLQGKIFGHLKVLGRADNHVTPSGQKKVMWNCECLLCGSHTIVNAQMLKSGNTTSCGCYRPDRPKNVKKCAVCGKEFECPPSGRITCSSACHRKYVSGRLTGTSQSEETKRRISLSAQGRDMSELQKLGSDAIRSSPKYGKFVTNVNAIDWHLISPDGKHYYFHSLANWLRENGEVLFGCMPDSREFCNVKSGLSNAKRATLGYGTYQCVTYKGWRVVPTENDTN